MNALSTRPPLLLQRSAASLTYSAEACIALPKLPVIPLAVPNPLPPLQAISHRTDLLLTSLEGASMVAVTSAMSLAKVHA